MDWTTTRYASVELKANLPMGKPVVLIVNGREHNIIVESIGDVYVTGRVALNKVAVLIDRPGRGGAVARMISPQEEKTSVGPGDEMLHSEPCVVASAPRIQIKIESIDILEEPWRPFLPDSVFAKDGSVVPALLCEAIPAFAEYAADGKFVSSPAAWTGTQSADAPNSLRITTNSSDSSEG